ncbi:hypothetical protein HHK36_008493 [Tetracentron sinense]|uniref:Uncharacterized protein n=1 Tax=Tetracentron sinense TaxID=13715 RepID=A0A834ZGG2_TETSI|nr:hypothetical protein HHK36_008493 [Tetracentron sinense]
MQPLSATLICSTAVYHRSRSKSLELLDRFLLQWRSSDEKTWVFVNCNSFTTEHEHESEKDSSSLLDRQKDQLEKLENLVRNLSDAVARLESCLPESRIGSVEEPQSLDDSRFDLQDRDQDKIDRSNYDDGKLLKDGEKGGFEGKTREGERGRGVSVTKYNPLWSERFQFLSAVKLESEATCINVLPFKDYEGFSKYVAVGDNRGRVYIFLLNGDVLVEFYTLSDSPITAMLSYMSVHKNESIVVTGHRDGVILVHRVWEASNGEDWHSLSMANFLTFPSTDKGGDNSPIMFLEVHQVGRTRYILSSDVNGKIRVFRENGTVYGSAISASQPIAFLKQRLLFLTEKGAGSLDLRSMKVRESECEGMNRSLVRNYVFDASERSKAYGFTSEGDLIQVVLLGDIINFKCRVRSKRKFEMDEPFVVQALKGYLLIVNQDKVFVYNTSSQHYVRVGVPRLLFFASLDEIRSSFLNFQGINEDSKRRRTMSLIASDREKLVVLGLGSGYVGMYRSNLPVFKPEQSTMFWTSHVLLFILFLFGAWQFFGKKKESLTLWGPDDPFTSSSISTGAPLVSGSGDRTFADSSSRSADIMELRGGALRGPTRRYVSPSRYPGGGANTYRASSADSNFRPSSADPNFRTAAELKFRGANLEPTGLPKRRESLFPNNQVVEDNIN